MCNLEYNFWDDRTHGVEINPCAGCDDYDVETGSCTSNGGCATAEDV